MNAKQKEIFKFITDQLPEKYTLFQLATAMRMANEKWQADDDYKDDLNIVLQRIFKEKKNS